MHGLRTCADGENVQQRDGKTIFGWESFDFYNAMTPLVTAYATHGREDLFLKMIEVLYRHWGDASASASECEVTATTSCTRDGVNSYEPIVSGTPRERHAPRAQRARQDAAERVGPGLHRG